MTDKAIRNARELLASRGRMGDTELAHISRGERRLIEAWQGYQNVNPHTGLAEYFSFKKVLKGIAKAAGAVAGGVIGGPAGAAIGGALGTKLTGGSWKSALGTGLLSGISSYGLQQSGLGDTMGISALGKGTDLFGRVGEAATSAAADGAGSFDWKSLLPVAAVGIGALGGGPKQQPALVNTSTTNTDSGPTWEVNTKPLDRDYQEADDYYNYGQYGGEHEFYDDINAPGYRHGGTVQKFKGGGGGSSSSGRDRGGPGGGSKAGPGGNRGGGRGRGAGAFSDAGYNNRENTGYRAGAQVGGFRGPGSSVSTGGLGGHPSGRTTDPTTLRGLFDRIPGPLTGISNIVSGTATPSDVVQTGAQIAGMTTGAPLGPAVGLGIGMGKAVTDVQAAVDAGTIKGKTETDPSMGRVDTVDGRAYSHGNPASDSRAANTSGLGGGMVGGGAGRDISGSQVLSALTQTFNPLPQQGAPTGYGIGSGYAPGPVDTSTRKYVPADDYYTYGQQSPEWRFFDRVNPVTSAATGGKINGPGDGQDDKIPAMLSDGEYVIDAATVSAIGSGSTSAGFKKLDKMREQIRKRAGYKNTKSIPPKQRGIGSLLKGVA